MANTKENKIKKAVSTFFFGSDEEKKELQTTQEQESAHVVQANTVSNFPTQTSITMPSSETTVSGLVDNNTIDMIWNAVRSAKHEGPDYNTLTEIAQKLVGIVPDETMRFQGAFNILKGKYPNLTKKDLIVSIEECIAVVEEQRNIGLSQCEQKKVESVDGKRAEAARFEEKAYEMQKQIEEMKQQYNEMLETVRKLSAEASNVDSEIKQQKQVFENSILAVMNSLNSDKAKVSNLSV